MPRRRQKQTLRDRIRLIAAGAEDLRQIKPAQGLYMARCARPPDRIAAAMARPELAELTWRRGRCGARADCPLCSEPIGLGEVCYRGARPGQSRTAWYRQPPICRWCGAALAAAQPEP